MTPPIKHPPLARVTVVLYCPRDDAKTVVREMNEAFYGSEVSLWRDGVAEVENNAPAPTPEAAWFFVEDGGML